MMTNTDDPKAAWRCRVVMQASMVACPATTFAITLLGIISHPRVGGSRLMEERLAGAVVFAEDDLLDEPAQALAERMLRADRTNTKR
jgi:hypothetical protein